MNEAARGTRRAPGSDWRMAIKAARVRGLAWLWLMAVGLVLGWMLTARLGWAHGVGPGQAQLLLDGATVKLTLTPYLESVKELDLDRDGLLTREELSRMRAQVLERVQKQVVLKDERGREPVRIFADALVGRDHHEGTEGAFLKLVLTYRWPEVPQKLTLRYALFNGQKDVGLLLTAGRVVADEGGEKRLDLRVPLQETLLTPAHPLFEWMLPR
ncbi:MAG: hypothetical protein ACKO6N_20050 [Myxococcota bacterium]